MDSINILTDANGDIIGAIKTVHPSKSFADRIEQAIAEHYVVSSVVLPDIIEIEETFIARYVDSENEEFEMEFYLTPTEIY